MPRRVTITNVDASNSYTFPINPIIFDWIDEDELKQSILVDGGLSFSRTIDDSRIRTMEWRGLHNKEPYITMVSNLKSYKSIKKRLYLNDLYGSTTYTGSILIVPLNVETRWAVGGSPNDVAGLKFEYIKFTYIHAGWL